MGLFDIFRRKSKQKKEEAPESAASENAESQAAAAKIQPVKARLLNLR